MNQHIHTSDSRKVKKLWGKLGGEIIHVRGTGEVRYIHADFQNTIRANDRRNDVPAVLLCRINHLLQSKCANDDVWSKV